MSLSINPAHLDDDDLAKIQESAAEELARRKEAREAAEAAQKAAEPKVKHRFRHTVNASGHFYTEAYSAQEADAEVQQMMQSDIIAAVAKNGRGGWVDVEVNDDEFPEDHGPIRSL